MLKVFAMDKLQHVSSRAWGTMWKATVTNPDGETGRRSGLKIRRP